MPNQNKLSLGDFLASLECSSGCVCGIRKDRIERGLRPTVTDNRMTTQPIRLEDRDKKDPPKRRNDRGRAMRELKPSGQGSPSRKNKPAQPARSSDKPERLERVVLIEVDGEVRRDYDDNWGGPQLGSNLRRPRRRYV